MIDLAHKDLGIALDVANQLHVPMPLGPPHGRFIAVRAQRVAVADWSAILNRSVSVPG